MDIFKKLFLAVLTLCLVSTMMTTRVITAEENTGSVLETPITEQTVNQGDNTIPTEVTEGDMANDELNVEPTSTPSSETVETQNTDNKMAKDGEAKATLYTNGWIIADDASMTFENGVVNLSWQIDEGGELASVEIKYGSETITLSSSDTFTNEETGINGELSGSGDQYSLVINNVTGDIDITIKGQAVGGEAEEVHVEALANGWIDMDKDTSLTFEEGIATLVFKPIEDGKLVSIDISNADNSITITDEGDFEFEGEDHSLTKVGDTYTLTLNNVSKDTTIKVTGGSIYPDATVDINFRR